MTGYLCDPVTGEPYNAETFNLDEYLSRFEPEWFESAAGRRELTRDDPLLFSCLYMSDVLKNHDGQITFSDVHLGLYRDALAMRHPAGIGGDRRAYAAPRNAGKSTTLWLLTTLWLATHHPCFVAAFSDTGTQSADHLKTLRRAMSTVDLIMSDYPDACRPMLNGKGNPIADSAEMYCAANGFSFSARGIDTGVLGLVDPLSRRPYVIMADDIEGQEGSGYSLYQASQRLKTITEGVLPMNDRAHVRLIGTVHLAGGILDDLVRSVVTTDPPAKWITEERFKVTYFEPIIYRPDGTRRSCWPGKWPVEFLESIEGTRAYAKAFLNQPIGDDGDYWTEADITYGDVPAVTRRILVIDPAVTSKRTSDQTGIAIVSYSPSDGRCLVEHAEGVRLTGGPLRNHLAKLIKKHPDKIHGCLVETNQGGDLWVEVLGPLGLKVITTHADESKEVRFASALDLYQKPRPLVVHATKFPLLESEMTGFPKYATDNVADAVVTGVLAWLKPTKGRSTSATVESYR